MSAAYLVIGLMLSAIGSNQEEKDKTVTALIIYGIAIIFCFMSAYSA